MSAVPIKGQNWIDKNCTIPWIQNLSPNLAGCPAPPFKLVFWLQIHISRQDCCKNFGHRFFQRIPQLNPMLNKWKSSWSRLLGQGSLKLHQQFCLAPIVGSYFNDLSISSNDCDHLVFLTLYAWLILSFFLVIKNFLFTVRLTVRGGGGLIYPLQQCQLG